MYGNTRYLNPTNDVSFKKLFGSESHKDLLISFLNSMLYLEGKHRIEYVNFLPQEMPAIFGEGKRSILDIHCRDASGARYIVEMQNGYDKHFIKRTQMYTAHAYTSQIKKGKEHFRLGPVVLLAVTTNTVFPEKKNAMSYHKVLDVETSENDLKDISYVFIELSKFHKKDPSKLKTSIDKWLYFLKYWDEIKSPPETITEPELLEAYDAMERFNWNANELNYYFKTDLLKASQLATQESIHQESLEEGIEIGREKGIEKGLEMGRKEERVKAKIEKSPWCKDFYPKEWI